MKRIRRLLVYLFSFGFARGALFVSPILLANLLPSHVYGVLEWAHAAASLGGTLAVLGVSAVLPLIVLRKIPEGSMAGILAHHILVVLACVALIYGVLWLSGDDILMMAALLVAVIALQSLWSIHLKTHGKVEASLLLDAGLFVLMASTAAMAVYFHAADSLRWVFWAVAGYTLCLFYITVVAFFKELKSGEIIAYQATLVQGFPLMTAMLVAIVATTSGRLLIGYLGGTLLVAEYAILARAAALPIIAHQIVLVAKFRHLFTLPDKEMERVISFVVGMVVLSVVLFSLLFPVYGWVLGSVFVQTFEAHSLPALWILTQSILWSGIAMNDLINTRYQTTRKVLPWTIGFLIISIPAAMVLIQYIGVSLAHFVYVHGILMLLFYIIQTRAMYLAGIRLIRSWTLAAGSYILFIAFASLLYS